MKRSMCSGEMLFSMNELDQIISEQRDIFLLNTVSVTEKRGARVALNKLKRTLWDTSVAASREVYRERQKKKR